MFKLISGDRLAVSIDAENRFDWWLECTHCQCSKQANEECTWTNVGCGARLVCIVDLNPNYSGCCGWLMAFDARRGPLYIVLLIFFNFSYTKSFILICWWTKLYFANFLEEKILGGHIFWREKFFLQIFLKSFWSTNFFLQKNIALKNFFQNKFAKKNKICPPNNLQN